MSILIFLIALLFASPVEAQVWCGYGRWVNGFFRCPPTTAERIEYRLRANQRVLREQQRTLEEIKRTQQEIAARPEPAPLPAQVIVIQQPAKPIDTTVGEPAALYVPDVIHRRLNADGTWYFSNVQ
jgi:hypothetical protein